VFGQDDVSGEFQIDGAGNITMPLLGQVHAASRTLTELRADITTALDRDYIVNPKVSIEVLNYRPFYILGQVASPGSYPYVTGMDVRQAVAIAGGFTPRARTSTVTVIRQSAQGAVKIEATPDVPVLPGDTIEIQRRLF
jgi:polysaccharide export outer membrane protein